jgi:hypothetical protein
LKQLSAIRRQKDVATAKLPIGIIHFSTEQSADGIVRLQSFGELRCSFAAGAAGRISGYNFRLYGSKSFIMPKVT